MEHAATPVDVTLGPCIDELHMRQPTTLAIPTSK